MRRFTILHTIETGGPGGAETVLFHLARRLDGERFRSLVLLTEDGWLRKSLQQEGAECLLIETGPWYDFRLLRALASTIRREKVDLIHSHLPDQNFYSCLAGKLTGRPAVVTYHGPIELAKAREWRQAVKFWWVRKSAATVVVVCDSVARLLIASGFPPRKITRIYNGIDASRFSPSGSGKLRKELGLTDGSQLVGMVANIRGTKGYEFFIAAARQVADSVPGCRFVAIGDIDPRLGNPLVEMVRKLGLEDRFHFLGFRADLPEILSDLDVFVLSSVSEGFPLATLEAMAAARPMVVTRCGGPEEAVVDGQEGLLIPAADAGCLAQGIGKLLDNPEKAAELGRNARAKVSSVFSISQMVQAYEDLYLRILGSR